MNLPKWVALASNSKYLDLSDIVKVSSNLVLSGVNGSISFEAYCDANLSAEILSWCTEVALDSFSFIASLKNADKE